MIGSTELALSSGGSITCDQEGSRDILGSCDIALSLFDQFFRKFLNFNCFETNIISKDSFTTKIPNTYISPCGQRQLR